MKISPSDVRRGDVRFADLGENETHEQRGKRPVLVIQNDVGNYHSPTVIVAAMTSRHKNDLPTHVLVKNGLDRTSTVMLEQLFTIDKRRLLDYVCHFSDAIMDRVRTALEVSLAI